MAVGPLTDYEKYIRTEELLRLQKEPLSCHDELLFQIVNFFIEISKEAGVFGDLKGCRKFFNF